MFRNMYTPAIIIYILNSVLVLKYVVINLI
jgi:hypothetical protein